jgi:NADH-quinone oxidoreductase subunit N
MVSDLVALYLVIELLSFALYLLAAIDRESPLSGEGGLKYFLLGALSSAFMLLGIGFIYGLTGQTSYTALQ